MIQAKRDKINIKKLNHPGVFKKSRGNRDIGEKFDSKFYPDNYKKDVLYMDYNDLLDNIYMENKGINLGLRTYKNNKNKNKDKNINKKSTEKAEEENELMKKYVNKQFTFKQNYENNNENNFEFNDDMNKNKEIELNSNNNNIQKEEEEINVINKINNQENKENFEKQNISNSNNDENNINNNIEYEDMRLNYVMIKLGLDSLISIFEQYQMSFNDILFLTNEDLEELGLKIYQKNRLLSFIKEYSSKAKNYTLEEIEKFFEENKIYNISNPQE